MIPFSLAGKKVFITGASSGIGRAITIACGQMGAELILTGRDEERLNNTLASAGGNGKIFKADLLVEEELHSLVSSLPVINGVVHCAGILKIVPFKNIQFSVFDEIQNVNFRAPVFLTQQLIKKKKIAGSGSIVYISSVSGSVIGASSRSIRGQLGRHSPRVPTTGNGEISI